MVRNKIDFWRDPVFWAGLAAALAYWAVLYLFTRTAPDLAWPLRDPRRFLIPALLYPVVEEVVFRGLVQDAAHRHLPRWKLGPISHANLITSVIFSALHVINHPPLWAAAVFLPSLLFGLLKDRSGGLTAPILMHAFYNSGYFWLFTH